jgi:hypothetical protein
VLVGVLAVAQVVDLLEDEREPVGNVLPEIWLRYAAISA